MSKAWIRSKREEFVRDVFRDFCQIHFYFDQEFQNYEQTGAVDFVFMRDLLGEETNKGLLWRLKDTAHLLFRNYPSPITICQFLDWAIGYIFHESIKLKEDAYQQQNYGPWFQQIQQCREVSSEELALSQELLAIVDQTRESISREVSRIRFILVRCRRMFRLFLVLHRDNKLLARLLYDRKDLIHSIYSQEELAALLDSLYPQTPEKMYILASQSLRQGGWFENAARALDKALQINPENSAALQEKQFVAKQQGQLRF